MNRRQEPWKSARQSIVIVCTLATASCAGIGQRTGETTSAVAELRDGRGNVVGNARLSEVKGGVRVLVEARGLPPGVKAVHVHEVGACTPPEFTSAGGHFNPEGKRHGFDNPEGPHAGDLPNITIRGDGTGRLETMNERLSLGSGPTSLFHAKGTAIVIHAGPDDFKTDPAGNSGARIACGVITRAR